MPRAAENSAKVVPRYLQRLLDRWVDTDLAPGDNFVPYHAFSCFNLFAGLAISFSRARFTIPFESS